MLSRGRWWTPLEVGGFAASLLVLVLVAVNLPGPPEYPTSADFRDASFNPFAPLAKYRAPDCEATAVAWSSRHERACPADRDVVADAAAADAKGAGTLELKCGLRKDGHGPVPSEQFYKPLKEAGRVHFLNFTGAVSGLAVSAVVVLPDEQYQSQPLPVVYALHPRDQGYEKIDENGRALRYVCVRARPRFVSELSALLYASRCSLLQSSRVCRVHHVLWWTWAVCAERMPAIARPNIFCLLVCVR